MTRYAEYLLARPKKPALTSMQAARPARRYQKPMDEKGLANLSQSISTACDRFFVRRGLVVESRSWGFRGVK